MNWRKSMEENEFCVRDTTIYKRDVYGISTHQKVLPLT